MINETDGLSPEETLVELLKQKKAKISVAYDSEAKEKRLYVSHSSISDDKPVSARVAE